MKVLIELQLPGGAVLVYEVEADSLETAQAAANYADSRVRALFADEILGKYSVLSVEEIADGAISQ